MNRDIQSTFSLYRKLSQENIQFRFRLFQWLKKGLQIKSDRDKVMQIIKIEMHWLVGDGDSRWPKT